MEGSSPVLAGVVVVVVELFPEFVSNYWRERERDPLYSVDIRSLYIRIGRALVLSLPRPRIAGGPEIIPGKFTPAPSGTSPAGSSSLSASSGSPSAGRARFRVLLAAFHLFTPYLVKPRDRDCVFLHKQLLGERSQSRLAGLAVVHVKDDTADGIVTIEYFQ